MKLAFHGAARTVTGSNHLLDTGRHKLLLDCGMFQGSAELERKNHETFAYDPSTIEYVFLSHAHLDHCGRLPKLVKEGFTGKIICSKATSELTRLILLDAARLQKEDEERAMRHGEEVPTDSRALYSEEDVLKTIGMMETYNYGDSVKLSDNLEFRFRDAGHILGSCIVEIWAKNSDGRERKIVFSGDIGHRGQRIVKDPDMVSDADFVIIESTYGNRYHRSRDETVLELLGILREAESRKGNVIIPTFAVERAQEIIYELNLFDRNKLLDKLSVYLDSPMAIEATEIFRRYEEEYDEDAARLVAAGDDPLEFAGLHYSNSTQESKEINTKTGVIVMAGSGMVTGGRVVHHMINNLGRANSHIVFVGFQVPGTPGRRILDGESQIKLMGQKIDVQAKIHSLGGFSAHADQRELRYWMRGFGSQPQKVFIVHGEEEISESFAANLKEEIGQDTYVPSLGEEVSLA